MTYDDSGHGVTRPHAHIHAHGAVVHPLGHVPLAGLSHEDSVLQGAAVWTDQDLHKQNGAGTSTKETAPLSIRG